MFDIGWSELLVIAVIAIVVVGPKDLPRMLRAFGKTVGNMRRMAADFQRQFNDALREAELDEVRRSVEAIGRDDPFSTARRDLEEAARRLDGKPAAPLKAVSSTKSAQLSNMPAGPPEPPAETGAPVPGVVEQSAEDVADPSAAGGRA
jgi:sec-independent protein translocase protein TatB